MQDKTVPIDATCRAAAASIVQSILKEYVGAPHGLFATCKVQLTEDLLSFLNELIRPIVKDELADVIEPDAT